MVDFWKTVCVLADAGTVEAQYADCKGLHVKQTLADQF